MEAILETNYSDMGELRRGKVRDIYDLGKYFLIVATDRLSAFDVVFPQPIPDKGSVLTQISYFWFRKLRTIIDNHLEMDSDMLKMLFSKHPELMGRSMLVKKAKPLPVECIVRGYLTGSGLKDYKATGKVCGIGLPAGLVEGSKLEEPIFTPSTKAEAGLHDENISFERMQSIMDPDLAEEVRAISLEIYRVSRDYAETKGIIIADTKLEFGLVDNQLILIDEVLTPDSSRFWPKNGYAPGKVQDSFDKQIVRNHLEAIGWNKQPPAPELPAEVIEKTRLKYLEAMDRITI